MIDETEQAPADPEEGATPDPSWQADPFGRHEQRWWDGHDWTQRVADGDHPGIDTPVIDSAPHAPVADRPAPPITDALLPLPRRDTATTVGVFLTLLAIMALLVLTVALVVDWSP